MGARRGGTRSRAFTLVETLVVMGIIAIVTGMVLPVFLRGREMARRGVCTSNLKQMLTAYEMYLQDWNAPPLHNYLTLSTQPPRLIVWEEVLLPYAGDKMIFVCPDDADQSPPPERDMSRIVDTSYECYGAVDVHMTSDPEHGDEQATLYYDAFLRDQIIFACRRHDRGKLPWETKALVGYQDGSVKWERVPESILNGGTALVEVVGEHRTGEARGPAATR